MALFPLASHGNLRWEPLCAQIGGLSITTVITLLLLPVIYAIVVFDLQVVTWERPSQRQSPSIGGMPLQPVDVNELETTAC